MASIIEVPSRIVRLDLSLNELAVLDHAGLRPYRNLRELNASLNKISKYESDFKTESKNDIV
jgi:hypothetical protein